MASFEPGCASGLNGCRLQQWQDWNSEDRNSSHHGAISDNTHDVDRVEMPHVGENLSSSGPDLSVFSLEYYTSPLHIMIKF